MKESTQTRLPLAPGNKMAALAAPGRRGLRDRQAPAGLSVFLQPPPLMPSAHPAQARMHQRRPLRLSMWTGVGLLCHRLASVATAASAAAAAVAAPPPRALQQPPGFRPRPDAAAPSAAPQQPGLSSRAERAAAPHRTPTSGARRWGSRQGPARPVHFSSEIPTAEGPWQTWRMLNNEGFENTEKEKEVTDSPTTETQLL
ncbi:translation initiation factor IF-2-like [Elephas maximus indicus]|uniref:translation initiation factor IF-2-like n=1 Tax=Elephas maximus indicus TaxID=99487 RepID=UPI00211623CE|nr:translation initiation factor IF-2-like [Elephas maximus indicus]